MVSETNNTPAVLPQKRHGSVIPSQTDLSLLAQPLTLPFSGKVIKNRFCKAALSECLGGLYGEFDKEHLERYKTLYESWAAGGSGLILTGNVMVDRTMRVAEYNVAVEDSRDLERLKIWAQTVQKHGAAMYAQICHPGRQTFAHVTPNPVAPSALPVSNFHPLLSFNPPRELTTEEIQALVVRFVKTTEILYKAGFDGVEIHAAHGYLISQFLNPRTNVRTHDQYGGSLENRARFLIEIIQGIKQVVPKEFSIGVKLNSVDFGRRRQSEGTAEEESNESESVNEDLEEAVKISLMLEELEVDFIEVSGGSYEGFAAGMLDGKGIPDGFSDITKINEAEKTAPSVKASTLKREAHFAIFAERISRTLKTTKIILTGGFVTAAAMTESLKSPSSFSDSVSSKNPPSNTLAATTLIDMVGIGRPICHEPDLPNLIMSGAVTGAIVMPKKLGGFFTDLAVCEANIRRMANGQRPLVSSD
ncbi:hypothetical protein FBU30_006077 [Linnemannia zychae]|nr:hypothetical protein FBU30_006077 [Linnemannia zychae]